MRAVVGWWLVAMAVYVSFVSVVWTQVVAGAVVAALAVALSLVVLRSARLRVGTAAPQVWRVRAVGAILARELRAVLTALPALLAGRAGATGRFVAVRLPHRLDPAEDAAVTMEASLAPNTYVVGIVQGDGEDLLLVHQLAARGGILRSFPRWNP